MAGPAVGAAASYQSIIRRSELLLILDNCEHLLDACAELTGGLLRAAPGLRDNFAVTTRATTGRGGRKGLPLLRPLLPIAGTDPHPALRFPAPGHRPTSLAGCTEWGPMHVDHLQAP